MTSSDVEAGVRTPVSEAAKVVVTPADVGAWARSLTRIVRQIEASNAKVVGLASDRPGAGVTSLVRALAQTYADFGRRVSVIDAADEARSAAARGTGDVADLKAHFRTVCAEAQAEFDVVLVDLPPAMDAAGRPAAVYMSAGAVCDAALLVCLSGEMTRADLVRLVDNSRISQIKIMGILLNDRDLPLSNLLGEV